MDRDAIAQRNQLMARAFHADSPRHRLRRAFIHGAARLPIASQTAKNRVLLIRPDHLGDMILATPAMLALRQSRPNLELHVLASPSSAAVLAHLPAVDRVLTTDFPGFNRNVPKESLIQPYTHLLKVAHQLRLVGYETAIIMRADHWWGAMLAYLSGIRQRIGYDLPDVMPFLTEAMPFAPASHAVRQNMRLVERWTGFIPDSEIPFGLHVAPQDADDVTELLRQYRLHDQRLVAIHPGAGTWVKQWDTERWAVVADTLTEQLGARVIFTGTERERSLVDHIQNAAHHKTYTTVGALKIGQLAALFARCAVVLGPDSGPLHLAAAVGAPTVALFGPADPQEFAPWGPRTRHAVLTSTIACRPCRVLDWADDDPQFHPCVRDIGLGEVLDAARRVARR
ncbi:MAG: glycosyltransferase family 9 protein [Anaerolineae bacterium]|nr:glycosyltransferase family 9 protein [Anaerolineae bacterium]MDW8173141.1 glycosyltransferase family 9 protein [Anaerolineae bacterium]